MSICFHAAKDEKTQKDMVEKVAQSAQMRQLYTMCKFFCRNLPPVYT